LNAMVEGPADLYRCASFLEKQGSDLASVLCGR